MVVCFLRRKPHLQLYGGSLSGRGQRYLSKLAQAIADVLVNATRVCNTSGNMFEFVGGSCVVAKCCERPGQSLFVVDTKYHLSFDVTIFYKDLVTENRAVLSSLMASLACDASPRTAG